MSAPTNTSTPASASTEEDKREQGATRNVVRQVTQRLVNLAVEELKQEEMRTKIKDHVMAPLVHLIYCQMFPYLVVAGVVILSGIVMWILMFTMFALTFHASYRK